MVCLKKYCSTPENVFGMPENAVRLIILVYHKQEVLAPNLINYCLKRLFMMAVIQYAENTSKCDNIRKYISKF